MWSQGGDQFELEEAPGDRHNGSQVPGRVVMVGELVGGWWLGLVVG